jgi:hypothetical protein
LKQEVVLGILTNKTKQTKQQKGYSYSHEDIKNTKQQHSNKNEKKMVKSKNKKDKP